MWIGGGLCQLLGSAAPSVVPYEDIATAAASCASPPPPRLVPLAKLLLRSNFSCPSPSSSPETALRILFPPLPNLPLPVQRRGLDAGSFAGQRLRRIESEQRQHHRRSRSLLLKGPMSAISDQKKRTLESLQQQYTAAKAKKLHDEHLKCHKKSNFDAPKTKFDTPRKGKAPELTPRQTSAQSSSHKGTAFSGSNRQQKSSASSGKDVNPVYAELSCPLHENLFQDGNSGFDSTEVVQSVIYDIIQKGGDSGKITKGGKKLKLEKGILLDNYVQRVPRLVDAQARSLLIHSKRSKQHMSLKQHKKCGSFDLDCTFHKYDLYKPMHEMWKAYITELTKITPKKQLSENLLSADLHGALLIVAECKAAPYQGISGIMIRDTAETFGIISEDNRFRVVPKAGSVFILQADCWKVTLIGDKLSPKLKLKEGQHQQRTQSQIR